MRVEQLRELAKVCRTNPHYQYRDKSDAAFLASAVASFQRLPDKQQEKVTLQWADCLRKNGELGLDAVPSNEQLHEMVKLRYLAQTNLFFLCHLLEKYNETTVATHEEICNQFFVEKDPTCKTFEEFADKYSDIKQRLLLTPRGGFKSSIDIADCVQWIICFPAVTILILTGVYTLAGDFVGELRRHFTLEENGIPDPKTGKSGFGPRKLMHKKTGEWSDSLFQVLFPEHCIAPGEGGQFKFHTPAGGDEKEPTVRAASIEQALSGMHFCVMKLDDVVTNENSCTPTRLEAVNKQISINNAMLHPYGFFDVIGTWYDEKDYYGLTIKQEETFAKELGTPGAIVGSVDSGRFGSSVNFKVYLRAAWWPTPAAIELGKIEDEMGKGDWELWFPERLTYEVLSLKKKTDPDGFPIKYLNNPRKLHQVKFPRELLMRRTIPHSQLPQQGIVVTCVDTAYSTKSWADYTVILTALIFGGRFYIINMKRGRYNEIDLPAMIAAAAYQWKPKRIAIEESVGVKWMGRELRREMDKLQISIPVEYVSLGAGSKAKSKQMKAKPVLRLLGDERMYFLNSCEGIQEIYSELEKFTGTGDDAHDDIVSALSILADQFGAYADMEAKVSFANTQYVSDRQSKERHDMMYALGNYRRFRDEDDNPVTQFEVTKAAEVAPEAEIDPLGELF